MTKQELEKLNKALLLTLEICGGVQLSDMAMKAVIKNLSRYELEPILIAMAKCHRDVHRMQNPIADIMKRYDDGRPGSEEAWGMLPKSEWESALWTEDMQRAYRKCAMLLDHGDHIAARKTFLEAYDRIVAESRALCRPVSWHLTVGTDLAHREGIVKQAVQTGYLSPKQADMLLPEHRGEFDSIKQISEAVGFKPKMLEG